MDRLSQIDFKLLTILHIRDRKSQRYGQNVTVSKDETSQILIIFEFCLPNCDNLSIPWGMLKIPAFCDNLSIALM